MPGARRLMPDALHFLQKRHWDLENQILIEPIDTNHNTVFRSDPDQFTGKTDKRAIDDFYIVTFFEFFGRYFNLGIAVNNQTEIIYLVLGDRDRLSFERDEFDNSIGHVNFREIFFTCSYKYI